MPSNGPEAHGDVIETNRRHWEWAVAKGAGCTVPWLDLDPAALRAWAQNPGEAVPQRLADLYTTLAGHLATLAGRDVLCLGAGGGQQSAVFGLLGAHVTVLDLCEAQLAGDRAAAAHWGYSVRTIRGDMGALNAPWGREVIDDRSLDLVYCTGLAFVRDLRPVYAGIGRVLRPGGICRVDLTNPAREFVDEDSWDGGAYRITVPYHVRRHVYPADEGGEPSIQFRHYLDKAFNGLLDAGFAILRVHDLGPREPMDTKAEPGSWDHAMAFLPGSLAIVAERR